MSSIFTSFLSERASALRLSLLVGAMTAMATCPQAHAVGVPGQGTWQTTLQGRDLDGNLANGFEAYYDTDLNLTWLADTAAFKGGWHEANAWAANLNVNGVTGWRLPTVTVWGSSTCDWNSKGSRCYATSTSEMGHMFNVTLGNKSAFDAYGNDVQNFGLSNAGPFKNLTQAGFWTDVDYSPTTDYAWYYSTYTGSLASTYKSYMTSDMRGWAVRPGDVVAAAVPEPQTSVLSLLGLSALFLAVRGRRQS